jgi:hypothetical protein
VPGHAASSGEDGAAPSIRVALSSETVQAPRIVQAESAGATGRHPQEGVSETGSECNPRCVDLYEAQVGRAAEAAERLIGLSDAEDFEEFKAIWDRLTAFEQRSIALGLARMLAAAREPTGQAP